MSEETKQMLIIFGFFAFVLAVAITGVVLDSIFGTGVVLDSIFG